MFQVIAKLSVIYGQLYKDENVMISATHNHAGPGGFSQYFVYHATSLGFYKDSLNAIVDGIVLVSVSFIFTVQSIAGCDLANE